MKRWTLEEARADYRTCKNCEFFYGEYHYLHPEFDYEECKVKHKRIVNYRKAKRCKYFTVKEV